MLRSCVSCGRPGNGTRCTACGAGHERARSARRPEYRTAAETKRRRDAVAWHVACHGWTCPGDAATGHLGHPSRDLTAHHAEAFGAGGREAGPLRVLCRSANSAIGART